jgi:hypothetical protein
MNLSGREKLWLSDSKLSGDIANGQHSKDDHPEFQLSLAHCSARFSDGWLVPVIAWVRRSVGLQFSIAPVAGHSLLPTRDYHSSTVILTLLRLPGLHAFTKWQND